MTFSSLTTMVCTEAHKQDGDRYPPKTIQHYLMGLQQHIRSQKKNAVNFMVDSEFFPLRNLLDALYCRLHPEGIGCSEKKTVALTNADEEKLWQSAVLNPETPQGLLNCVFFVNDKNFCCTVGVEHRELKLSQLCREVVTVNGEATVRYTYTEYGSKNRSGGLKQLRQENKVIHQYESANAERCPVRLLDKYIHI